MRDDDLGNADEQAAEDTADRSVGTLELFFDLVFVYTMSQVTVLMLADISWAGFGRGVLALAAVWWAWACYAWLTNTSDHDGPRASPAALSRDGGHADGRGRAAAGVRRAGAGLCARISGGRDCPRFG